MTACADIDKFESHLWWLWLPFALNDEINECMEVKICETSKSLILLFDLTVEIVSLYEIELSLVEFH